MRRMFLDTDDVQARSVALETAPAVPGQECIETGAEPGLNDVEAVSGSTPSLGQLVALQENVLALCEAVVTRIVDVTESARKRGAVVCPVDDGTCQRPPGLVVAVHPGGGWRNPAGSQAGRWALHGSRESRAASSPAVVE